MYDIIVVGAGPAGMTAAIFARRANKKVLVIEAKAYGGQILNATHIENYPAIESISGFDYAEKLYNQTLKLGAEIIFETVERVTEDRTVITNKGEYKAKAVILATGVQSRKLNIENESNFAGKGLSYCATCDGNFFRGKTVAVVGGGDAAIDDANYLADIANKVYLIHRRDEFTAEKSDLDILKSRNNVEFVLNANVKALNGTDKLESIDVLFNDETTKNIEVDGIFIAVGQEPKNEIFSNVVDLNEFGYIVSEDGVHTKTKGIYVAGDNRIKLLRQLTTAVSDGSIAATVAIKEFNEL